MNSLVPEVRNELPNLAAMARQYIDRLNGESEEFEVVSNGVLAVINYKAVTSEDPGDYSTAPAWDIEHETIEVAEAYDADGNECPEAAIELEKLLN